MIIYSHGLSANVVILFSLSSASLTSSSRKDFLAMMKEDWLLKSIYQLLLLVGSSVKEEAMSACVIHSHYCYLFEFWWLLIGSWAPKIDQLRGHHPPSIGNGRYGRGTCQDCGTLLCYSGSWSFLWLLRFLLYLDQCSSASLPTRNPSCTFMFVVEPH